MPSIDLSALRGQTLTLEIQDLSRAGSGVGRIQTQEGDFAVFIPLTAPGDQVRAEVTRIEKRYAEARLIEVLRPGPDRVEPRCVYFGRCGGCAWQHLPYEKQWQTKFQGVLHALKRTQVVLPSDAPEEFPAENPWNYRNRVQMRAEGEALGFFARGSRELVNIERCEIAREEINRALPGVRARAMEKLGESPQIKVEIEVYPDGRVEESWNSRHAALGFRQVNDAQNEMLKGWVANQLGSDAHLFDLYGGNGNLSWDLRDRMKWIDVVDLGSPREALPDQPDHYRFYPTDVGTWLKRRVRDKERGYFRFEGPFYAIIDPPREGLGDQSNLIAESLATLEVEKLVAIGCDPDSFARDLARLQKHGWKVEKLAVFDLFPQTPHVESAAVLTRSN